MNGQQKYALPIFSVVNQHYLIGICYGLYGAELRYEALDITKNIKCRIKEFFLDKLTVRNRQTLDIEPVEDFEKFNKIKNAVIEDSEFLSRFTHIPHTVHQYDFFVEHNSVYSVWKVRQAESLSMLTKLPACMQDVKQLANHCCTALDKIHRMGFIHKNISPTTIYIEYPSEFLLGGLEPSFMRNRTIPVVSSFFPPEAYSRTADIGPWTDVYALAATIYWMVSKTNLPDAIMRAKGVAVPSLYELGKKTGSSRLESYYENGQVKDILMQDRLVTKEFSDVIQRALSLDAHKRPQSAMEFLAEINNSISCDR